ncbi:MAG: hypothetical protein HYY03_06445 [Chloroflexi bacterium]|nr:hypothetical protein [Chloroflexota bacterium]
MKRIMLLAALAGAVVAVLAIILLGGSSPGTPGVAADSGGDGHDQSDHALFGSGDTAIYCGVEQSKAEPWILHVSATAPSSAGTLRITFGDGDSIGFRVAAGGSFSTTQALGGVPGVDNVVKLTAESGVTDMMASALVPRGGAKDPFPNDGEKDNFCLTKDGDPGDTPF